MFSKFLRSNIYALLAVMVVFAGCEKADMGLSFNVDDVTTYKAVQSTSKEVKFEQPSVNKSRVDQVGTEVSVTFDQKIEKVEADGSAVADITIRGIKYYSAGKKGVNYDYDSSRADEKKDALAGLIGQSYKISISRNGKVKVLDVAQISKAATNPESKALVKAAAIEARHEMVSLPEDASAIKGKGSSWSKVVSSPKGALDSKAFEKVFTVADVKKENEKVIATVKMSAIPTDKEPEGGVVKGGGLGFMANAFDAKETFQGDLMFDLTAGKLVKYSEEFKTVHMVAEEAKEGQADKGPDVLMITFVSSNSIEQVK